MMHIKSGTLRKTWFHIGGWIVCCMSVFCFITIFMGWLYLSPMGKLGSSTTGKFVDFNVPLGSSSRGIARQLAAKKLIRSEFAFRLALRYQGSARRLKAGDYQLQRDMSLLQILNELQKGRVTLKSWTVPEGLTISDIARLWETTGFGTSAEFLLAVKSTDLIERLQPGADCLPHDISLEGYLFPNTYKFAKGTSAKKVIEMMLAEFIRRWDETLIKAAEDLNMTRHQIVTLASIIEEEAQLESERHRIASVFHNRLKRNWKLQADPTVFYALRQLSERSGDIKGTASMYVQGKHRLTKAELKVDSPYNTYLYKGLPPAPISNPGVASIRAALQPEKNGYLYFVAIGEGRHHFSKTLSEHNRMILKIKRGKREKTDK